MLDASTRAAVAAGSGLIDVHTLGFQVATNAVLKLGLAMQLTLR